MKRRIVTVLLTIAMLWLTGCEVVFDESNDEVEYTVTFDSDGGSFVEDIKVIEGEKINKPDDPVRKGSEFDGWFVDKALSVEFDFDSPITSNKVIYCSWNDNIYTIQYLNPYDEVIHSFELVYNQDLSGINVSAPDFNNMKFKNWDIELPYRMPTHDIVIHAKYHEPLYQILFLDEDRDLLKSYYFHEGADLSNIQIEDPTIEGRPFIGWSEVLPEVMPGHDIEVLAMYEPLPEYASITFVGQNGYIIDYQHFIVGEEIPDFEIAEHPVVGLDHIGWSSEIPEIMPNHDIVIEAEYEISEGYASITFLGVDDYILDTMYFEIGSDLSSVVYPDPTIEGYNLSEWVDEIPATMPEENIVIRANYERILFTLSFFDENEELLSSVELEYGAEITYDLIPNAPCIDGLHFLGWEYYDHEEEQWLFMITNVMPSNDLMMITDYVEPYTQIGIYEIDDYLIINDRSGKIKITKFSDPSYERVIEVTDGLCQNDYSYEIKLDGKDLIILNSDDYSDRFTVSIYNLDDVDYYIEMNGRYEVKCHLPFNQHRISREIYVYGDYLIIGGFWSGYCCGGDVNQVYVFDRNDPDYYDVILRDNPIDWEHCCPGRGRLDIVSGTVTIIDSRIEHNHIEIFRMNDSDNPVIINDFADRKDISYTRPIGRYEDYYVLFVSGDENNNDNIYVYDLNDLNSRRVLPKINQESNKYYFDNIVIQEDNIILFDRYYNNSQGAVFIYKFSDPNYQRVITGEGMEEGDGIDASFTISNDTIVVNAPNYNEGTLFIYSLTDESFEEVISNTFGSSPVILDDYVILRSSFILSVYSLEDYTYQKTIYTEGFDTILPYEWTTMNYIIANDYLVVSWGHFHNSRGIVEVFNLNSSSDDPEYVFEGLEQGDYFGGDFIFDGTNLVIRDDYTYYVYQID